MTDAKRDVWKNNWVRGTMLPSGVQGHTFLARRKDDSCEEWNFILKTLKRQNDPDRRARFHVEVACLSVLDHPGVARLADSNADRFKESDELYLVTERIPGIDLEELAKRGALPLDVAAGILIRILKTLEYCHSKEIVHRDIKPCHVILRNERVEDPVLIDFGLAFNDEIQPTGFETETQQGVGNRFIILPEQMGIGPDKRDSRSDIAQCVGVLFFLLTGQYPGMIRHHMGGHKPHERIALPSHVLSQSTGKINTLRRIFDVGFEWEIARRWQSVASLLAQLNALVSDDDKVATSVSFEDRLEGLAGRIVDSPEFVLAKRVEPALQSFRQISEERWVKAVQRFQDGLDMSNQGSQLERRYRRFGTTWVIQRKFQLGSPRQVMVVVTTEGFEFRAQAAHFDASKGVLGFWSNFPPEATVVGDIRMNAFVDDEGDAFRRLVEDAIVDAIEVVINPSK